MLQISVIICRHSGLWRSNLTYYLARFGHGYPWQIQRPTDASPTSMVVRYGQKIQIPVYHSLKLLLLVYCIDVTCKCCMYRYIYIYTYIHIHVYMYIYIYTLYEYIHMYTYNYIHTLHYLALPYITFPYLTLPYITLHYITLHYIYICVYVDYNSLYIMSLFVSEIVLHC